MQRVPVIANIYGYAVCLIAVIVFFIGTAACISGVFQLAHPTPFHPFIGRNIRIERFGGPADMMWRERMPMQPGTMHPGGMHPFAMHPGSMPATAPQPPASALKGAPAALLANARYAAVRRITIALAMLVLAGILFARHWRWLQAEQ